MTQKEIDFDQIRKSHAGIFAALERATAQFKIEFYLLGTKQKRVRQNLVDKVAGIQAGIEFSVLVNNPFVWIDIVQYITKKENFYQDKKVPQMFYLRGTSVHLIPFDESDIFHEYFTDVKEQNFPLSGYQRLVANTAGQN